MRTEAAYGHIFVACVGFVGCIAFPTLGFLVSYVDQTLSKPILLGHSSNFIAIAASWLPLMGTLLVVRAFDRAAGVIQQAVKKLNADAEQDCETGALQEHTIFTWTKGGLADHVDAITRYTWTEVLLWTELAACTILIIVLCAQADFMSVTSPTFSILVVLAMAGILGCSFLVRSLIAAVLRREQEHTVIFLHHFHMRGYLVAAAQFVLVCFVIVVSTSCPWLIAPVAGPEKYEWGFGH